MLEFDASQYPQACPHESIREIGSDLFFAPGSIRIGPLMQGAHEAIRKAVDRAFK